MKKAFSLVELMIVVAILGIVAAIVFPEFQNYVQTAKEAAAKDNLRILREAIQRYAAEHNGIPPGYFDGTSGELLFHVQLIYSTNAEGQSSGSPATTETHPLGPYLSQLPRNPFNDMDSVNVLADGTDFPVSADGSFGWIYSPSKKEIRLDWPGTDSTGNSYYDY